MPCPAPSCRLPCTLPALLVLLALAACLPRPRIVSPADGSTIPESGEIEVEIALGAMPESGRLRVTLLRGLDPGPGTLVDLSDRFSRKGGVARGHLGPEDLRPGRNTLFASLDAQADGRAETVTSSTFSWLPPPSLRAAGCLRDITPVVGVNHSEPVFLAGFGNNRTPDGPPHDAITARGFVLESRGTKIAVVALDVIGYFYNEVQTIRALVDPSRGFDSITVASTHNHEGPDTLGLWGPATGFTGVDPAYLDFVNRQAAACIEEADDRLVPAEIRFATGSTVGTSLPPWPDLVADGVVLEPMHIPAEFLEGLSFVEDPGSGLDVQGDPGPILNPTVPSLQIRDRATGEILVTAINFASHPESLGSENRRITSDFPHFAREALEARYGGIALYLSADLGVLQGPLDVSLADPASPGRELPRRTFAFAAEMGRLLAERAAEALDAEGDWLSDLPLEVRRSPVLHIEVQNPLFGALATFGVFGRRPLLRDPESGALLVETEVQLLTLGPAQLAVTPNELDPQIGNAYRDAMHRA